MCAVFMNQIKNQDPTAWLNTCKLFFSPNLIKSSIFALQFILDATVVLLNAEYCCILSIFKISRIAN